MQGIFSYRLDIHERYLAYVESCVMEIITVTFTAIKRIITPNSFNTGQNLITDS